MLGAARVDADQREAVARRGVHRGHHLVVGDEEVFGAGNPGLDLDPDRIAALHLGEDVEARVVERLLDRAGGRGGPRWRGPGPPRAARPLWSRRHAAARSARCPRVASSAETGRTSAEVTTRGAFARHLLLAVEELEAVLEPDFDLGRLLHQARLALAHLLAAPFLFGGDRRLADQAVDLVPQARLHLVPDAVQLGLAARPHLVQVLREPVGDQPARRLLLGVRRARGAARACSTAARRRGGDAVEVGRRPGGSYLAVLVDVGVAEAAPDRLRRSHRTTSSITPTSRRGASTLDETSTAPRSSAGWRSSVVLSHHHVVAAGGRGRAARAGRPSADLVGLERDPLIARRDRAAAAPVAARRGRW